MASAHNTSGLPIMKCLIGAAIFSFASWILAFAQMNKDLQRCIDEGKKDNFALADRYCRNALKSDNLTDLDRSTIFYVLGKTSFDRGQYDQSIVHLTQVIQLNKKSSVAYNARGNAYARINHFDQAIADNTEAIRLDPRMSAAYASRGYAYYAGKGDFVRAIQDYNQAIKLDPHDGDTYYNRGVAYASVKDYEHAIADFDEAIRLNPADKEARQRRDAAYAAKKSASK